MVSGQYFFMLRIDFRSPVLGVLSLFHLRVEDKLEQGFVLGLLLESCLVSQQFVGVFQAGVGVDDGRLEECSLAQLVLGGGCGAFSLHDSEFGVSSVCEDNSGILVNLTADIGYGELVFNFAHGRKWLVVSG